MRIRALFAAAALTAGILLTGTTALAEPAPPTNGGNGAGHSGQCTANPADRPTVCPAA